MKPDRLTTALLASAILASCGRPPPPAPRPAESPASCRVGPDGGPAPGASIADRGIGGTGSPVLAGRGIGGTGIVGVITGFGSVCLAGQEVALPAEVPVLVNAHPAAPNALRAGQVAVIVADDSAGLSARRVDIRYEVIGQVDRRDGDHLRIAGQSVTLTPDTWGVRPNPGDWIAASGLREQDGTILATRLELATDGPVLVHGILADPSGGSRSGDLRLDALPVARTPQTEMLLGQPVTISGAILHGALIPLAVAPDLLLADPGAYFGPAIGTVLFEGFAVVQGGRVRLGPSFSAPAPGLGGAGAQRGVFRFERDRSGLRAVPSTRDQFAPTTAPHFEPAPTPDRAIGGPGDGRSPFARPGRFGGSRQGQRAGSGSTVGPGADENRPDSPSADNPIRPFGGPSRGGR